MSTPLTPKSKHLALVQRVTDAEADIASILAGGPSGTLPYALNSYGGKRLRGPYRPPSGGPVLTTALRQGSAPAIARGGVGSWKAGSVRDVELFVARGLVWALYTGASSATAPFNPRLGLAWSADEGETWTEHPTPVVLPPTGYGSVFSPAVWYDDTTDVLYMAGSVTEQPGQWYSGPIKIGLWKCAAGADWTDPASWVFVKIILEKTLSWEGSQGVYAGSLVRRLDGKFVLFYSTSNSGAPWLVGAAVADTIEGTYTPTGAAIVGNAGSAFYAEEPSVLQLPDGTWIMLCDAVEQLYGARWFHTDDPEGLTGWTLGGTYLTTPSAPGNWDANVIGSSSGVFLPSGEVLVMYSGRAAGGGTDARDLGIVRLTFQGTYRQLEARVAAVEASSGGSGGGPGGNVTNYPAYTSAARPDPDAGAVIFDTTLDTPLGGTGTRWVDFVRGTADLQAVREYLIRETSGASLTSPLRGVPGAGVVGAITWDKGLVLTGANYVDLGVMALGVPLTVVAIVRRTVGGAYDTIISGTTNRFKFGFTNTNKLKVDASGVVQLGESTSAYAPGNAYRFVAVTLGADGTLTFYNAAGADGTSTVSLGQLSGVGSAFNLSRDPTSNLEFLTGTLTYVGWTDRVLSAAAIGRLYAQLAAYYLAAHGITVV